MLYRRFYKEKNVIEFFFTSELDELAIFAEMAKSYKKPDNINMIYDDFNRKHVEAFIRS